MATTLKKHGGAKRLAYQGKTYDFTGPEATCTVQDDRLARQIAKEHREVTITGTQKAAPKPRATKKPKEDEEQ